jgi:CelD/BcsL family acetyltransferase involved in cellulose biosynthesis
VKVELITSLRGIESIAPEWDDLACRSPRDGFFRTYGWYRAWLEHIRPDAEPFVLAVRNSRGEIVGLAPLCRGVYRDLGFRLKAIFWGGREVVSGDFLDFLANDDSRPAAVAAMVEFLEENRSRFGLMVLGELLEGGDSSSVVETMGMRHRLPLRRQEERICPYIALPATFDEYLATLGSSTRYHIRRRMRDAERNGASVEICKEPGAVAERLDVLVRLHLARWQKQGLPGVLGRPGFLSFLRQICATPPAGSASRLYLLNHGGSTVAALLMFYCGRNAMYYQAGWDPDSRMTSLSPAVVLMAHSIRDAIQGGSCYYEFLRGDESYKSLWTKTCRKTATLVVGRSFMAKEYLRVARIKDLVKQSIRKRRKSSSGGAAIGEADSHAPV